METKLKECGRCHKTTRIWKAKTKDRPQMCVSCYQKEPKDHLPLVEQMAEHQEIIIDCHNKIKSAIANLKPANKKKVKTGKITLPELLKQTEKVFNAYIRKRDRLPDNTSQCKCCGLFYSYKDMDAGHFRPVGYSATRFDPLNVHACCQHCNRYLDGNLGPYRENLVAEFGEEAIVALEVKSRQSHKWSREELEEIIEKYK